MKNIDTHKAGFLRLATIGMLALVTTGIHAEDLSLNGLFYDVNLQDGIAAVRGYNYEESPTEVVIPSTVNYDGTDYPVTAVLPFAFNGTPVQTVTLGENIRTVGQASFSYCNQMTSLTLNTGLVSIEAEAFQNCSLLSAVTLPENLKTLGNYAFRNSPLSGEMKIPSKLVNYGSGPFRGSQISRFTVDNDNPAFEAINGVLFDKQGTTLINYPPLASESSYIVPAGVRTIAAESMRNALFLSEVTIPEGVETIGEMAFAQDALININIPATVTSIGRAVLFGNNSLQNISVAAGNTAYKAESGMLTELATGKLIAVPATISNAAIPEGITEIGDYTFYMAPNLTSVSFPASLKSTGYASFYGCPKLTTLDLGNGIEEIGKQAFDNCTALKNITFPSQLKAIREQAFGFCNSLKTVSLNDGLEVLENNAFFSCAGLQRVRVPGTIREFGFSTFASCEALTTAKLEEGLTEIPFTMFNFCFNLSTVNIPSTVTELGQSALYATSITSIELPEGLKKIGMSALYGTQLQELILPDSVEELGEYALAWSPKLRKIVFGKGMKVMKDNAISSMPALEELQLNEGLEEIGFMGITYCDIMTSLTIPSTVKRIGSFAFVGSPLTSLTNLAVEPQLLYEGEDIVANEEGIPIYDQVTLYVPAESIDAYRQAEIWKLFPSIKAEQSGVEEITETEVTEIVEIWTLDGHRVESPTAGIYVARMTDGTTRKIFISVR